MSRERRNENRAERGFCWFAGAEFSAFLALALLSQTFTIGERLGFGVAAFLMLVLGAVWIRWGVP